MTAVTLEAGTREARASLTERLAAWIDAEEITGNYSTAEIAARLIASIHYSYIVQWLSQGGSEFLRHAVRNHKDHADLTPAEAWAEDWQHGNLRDDMRRRSA